MMNSNFPIVGVFDCATDAERAVNTLRDLGFHDSQIGVTGRDMRTFEADEDQSYAAEGAAAGVASGAGIGLVMGLGRRDGNGASHRPGDRRGHVGRGVVERCRRGYRGRVGRHADRIGYSAR